MSTKKIVLKTSIWYNFQRFEQHDRWLFIPNFGKEIKDLVLRGKFAGQGSQQRGSWHRRLSRGSGN
jgi:hypothetical protein